MSRRRKKRRKKESSVNTRVLGFTILFYFFLFALIGFVFGYLVLYDLILSGNLGIPLITWFPHYSFTTSIILGVVLSELMLWPLILLKPERF